MKIRVLPNTLTGRIALLVICIFLANIALTWIFSVQYAKKLQMRETIQTVRALISHLNTNESLSGIEEFVEEYEILQSDKAPKGLGAPSFTLLKSIADRYNSKNSAHIDFFNSTEQPEYIWLYYYKPADGFETWIGITKTAFHEDHPYFVFAQEIIIILLIIFGSIITARSISRPIEAIAEATEQFGQGKSPAPLSENGTVETKKLSKAFNQMVDDHKALENERKLMLAGFSHDIRTPLARIQLSIDLLPEIGETSRNEIKHDIAQITDMQKQFMDYVTAGGDEPFSEFDLIELVHQSVARYASQVKGNIELKCPDAPIPFNGQALNISRVMCNLIVNAIKYGKPPITIICEELNDKVVIRIIDKGKGVDPAALDDIFKPMFRENACRKNTEGSGLGLAIVKRIVEKHNGEIHAENLPDGFCISITLIKHP